MNSKGGVGIGPGNSLTCIALDGADELANIARHVRMVFSFCAKLGFVFAMMFSTAFQVFALSTTYLSEWLALLLNSFASIFTWTRWIIYRGLAEGRVQSAYAQPFIDLLSTLMYCIIVVVVTL